MKIKKGDLLKHKRGDSVYLVKRANAQMAFLEKPHTKLTIPLNLLDDYFVKVEE